VCGIIATINKNGHRVSKATLEQYEKQKTRGSEGFGYCVVSKSGKISMSHATNEKEIKRLLLQEDASFTMFHHRYPTSTINVKECAHPIKVSHEELDSDYYIVHNGVIRNCDELKKIHESYKTPYVYTTALESKEVVKYKSKRTGKVYETNDIVKEDYNDSEAFAIELARCLDGMSSKINAIGTIAFFCIETDKKGNMKRVHYGRNLGNPLCLSEDGTNIFIKSVGGELIEKDHIFTLSKMEDGSVQESKRIIRVGYETEYEKNRDNLSYHTANTVIANQTFLPTIYADDDKPSWVEEYNREQNTDYKRNGAGFQPSPLNDDFDTTRSDEELEEKLLNDYLGLREESEFWEERSDELKEKVKAEKDATKVLSLCEELNETQRELSEVLAKMETVEEDYYYKIGAVTDFLGIVESYEELLEESKKAF